LCNLFISCIVDAKVAEYLINQTKFVKNLMIFISLFLLTAKNTEIKKKNAEKKKWTFSALFALS